MNMNGSFGGWLKQRRKALDLTQAELADQVGCTVTTIQKIEAALRRPSKQISERLADVLALSDEDRATFITFARRVSDYAVSPMLQPATPVSPSNLPISSTPFLGREDELTQIANRFADPNCRLLTLVGVGGIGKTRLALQAAAKQLESFTNGVYFVSLTPVGSTTLIAAAIANSLQLSFYGGQDPNIQVVNYLRGKHVLLVMDNYEHLLGGIDLLTDLLTAAPQLKILATSRERLNLHEEWVLQVDGLPFPIQPTSEPLSNYTAVQLFVQTAHRLLPGFSLEDNQDSVIDICRTVEGMPLGIELAVTWMRVMSCHQIAGQIRRDIDFLATPLRNIPDRHRSLRAVFEQSWGLLSDAERSVLMKLSVFRGGIDPEAAEQVAGASRLLLLGLVDKSLVRINPSGRLELHELLRQFAADKLVEGGERTQTELHHFQYFLGLAEEFEKWYFGPQHLVWMDRIELEQDNLRAALDWTLRVGEAELGLQIAGALGWFWNRRTYWHEGSEWYEKLLAAGSDAPISLRAKVIHHLLELSSEMENTARLMTLHEEGVMLIRQIEDPLVKGWLLCSVGFTLHDFSGIDRAYLDEALALFRKLDHQWGICETLGRLAMTIGEQGNSELSYTVLDEVIKLVRQAGDKSVLSFTLMQSVSQDWIRGTTDERTERINLESLGLFQELGYKHGILWALCQLGKIVLIRGEHQRAKLLFEQSLILVKQLGKSGGYATEALIGLSEIFCGNGQSERGALLLGAVDEFMRTEYAGINLYKKRVWVDYERALAAAHAHLDEATYAAAYAQGQMMTLDLAVAYALQNDVFLETAQPRHETTQALVEPLSVRECEVLRLVAEGCSNQEIADRLFIGVSTVKTHINHIYDKLDTKNRTQAVAYARDLNLLN